jgi:hypothetical protein
MKHLNKEWEVVKDQIAPKKDYRCDKIIVGGKFGIKYCGDPSQRRKDDQSMSPF